jgi:hypothetical protein
MAKTPKSLSPRTRRDQSGVAMVEFALVLPLLLTIVVGVMDFGKAFNYWIDQTHLANEGARWAVVNRNPSTAGDSLQQYIQNSADSSELRSGSEVCVDFPDGTSEVGDAVRMRMKIDYNWLPWFPNWLPGWGTTTTIRGEATMRLEAPPTNYSTADNIGTCA